jgi:hypothetical protein
MDLISRSCKILTRNLEAVPRQEVGRETQKSSGPAKNGKPVRFRIEVNGAAPGDDHGSDSAADGTGEVRVPQMYRVVRRKGTIEDGTFEIEFVDPGVQAFSFTFG